MGQGAGGGGGVGKRGGDESDAMGVAPAAVWCRSAQPSRASRIQCVRGSMVGTD